MIRVLDNSLMYLTKNLIYAAAFFGINRKTLALLSAQVSALAFALTFYIDKFQPAKHIIPSTEYAVLAFLGGFILFAGHSIFVLREYRDDDVISSGLIPYTLPHFRLLWIFVWSLFSIESLKYPFPVNLMYFFGCCPGPDYFHYILICQSPQNPKRLRNIIHNLFRAKAFATNPTT